MARVALAHYLLTVDAQLIFIPSNVCPALRDACGPIARLLPVSQHTGLSRPAGGTVVNLYGSRCQEAHTYDLEIDPLMTAWGGKSKADTIIISFGYSKTIDIGHGGALLTNNRNIAEALSEYEDFSAAGYGDALEKELDLMEENIARRKERWEIWEEHLQPRFYPAPAPTIPWRVICTVHQDDRDRMVETVRANGCRAGTNYPPLPGCTDPSSVRWGKEVINFWLEDDPKQALRGII